MQKYFTVYAAILGVLALLLFLSPQIAKFISANSTPLPAKTASPQTSATPISSKSPALPATSPSASPKLTAYPGWNVFALSQNINSDAFAKTDLSSFQMFGGKWIKSKKSQPNTTFDKNGAIYIYNPALEAKTIEISESQDSSALSPAKGWNLLSNNSDIELKAQGEFEMQGKKVKLADLILEKKASPEIYLLKSDKNGVEIKKIDPSKESIPAHSAFWLYLFN